MGILTVIDKYRKIVRPRNAAQDSVERSGRLHSAPLSTEFRRTVYLWGLSGAAAGFTVISGVLLLRALPPAEIGVWRTFALLGTYLPFLQLGILNGMNRGIPEADGRQDQCAVACYAAAAKWVAIGSGLISAILIMGVFLYWILIGSTRNALTAVCYLPILALLASSSYYRLLYRALQNQLRLAVIEVTIAALGVLLSLPVFRFGYAAMCLRGAVMSVILWGALKTFAPLRVRAQRDVPTLRGLLRLGLPILFSGTVSTAVQVLDVTLLAFMFGPAEVGYYIVVGGVKALMNISSDSVGSIFYPKMAHEFGRTGRPAALRPLALRALLVSCALGFPVALACRIAVPIVVQTAFPKYLPGLGAMKVAVWAVFGLSILPVNSILIVLKRFDYYLVAVAASAFVLIVSVLFLHASSPTVMVAEAFVLAQFARGIVILASAARIFRKEVIASNMAVLEPPIV